jgi:hypothetical protein
MITFKKEKTPSDSTVVIFETQEVTLTEILNDFKLFLMACGYSINPSDELVIFSQEDK